MAEAAELIQKAAELAVRTEEIVKARVFGPEGAAAPNVAVLPEERYSSFTAAGALIPPYDPETLTVIYEHSAALQPNVASYATNIESFGYRLEPTLDLAAPDANERIEEAIVLERLADGHGVGGQDILVTPAEVAARRALIAQAARIERLQVQLFFRYCNTDGGSFVELRERIRTDVEVTGNAYAEVIRNGLGQVAQLGYVPSLTCRLMRADQEYSKIKVPQKVSAVEYRTAPVSRRFRRFVQVINGVDTVFFKEFEDPRTVSSKTGKIYASLADLQKAEGENVPAASEILHFRVHSPRSAYGVPRWIGNLLAVLGSRASEEVNYLYFDNKGVPPLAVLVSGGTLAKDAVTRVQNYVNEHIKGRDNFHSILLIEAESGNAGTNNGKVRIELKPLREAQQDDALFQEYKKNNDESIGGSFRIPRILRGSMTDFNRATAEAALEYAEKLVFQPERARFDHLVNSRLFSCMGVRFWEFVSNSPVVRDPAVLAEMVSKLVTACVLTPEEGRAIAADIFNKNFPAIEHWWVKQPPLVTEQGLTPADTKIVPEPPIAAEGAQAAAIVPGLPADATGGDSGVARLIEALRAKLTAGAEKEASAEEQSDLQRLLAGLRDVLARANLPDSMVNDEVSEEHKLRLYVPAEVIGSWLEKTPGEPGEPVAAE